MTDTLPADPVGVLREALGRAFDARRDATLEPRNQDAWDEWEEAHAAAYAALAAVEREREALRAALPDPNKLLTLALWLDVKDEEAGTAGQDEVQQDLRRWAHAARALQEPPNAS